MKTSKMTLTAKSPEDVLAMVPVVLGFTPADSLVMLTFGAATAFHARVDLPDRPRDVRQVAASLLEPAARHGVRRVLLVGYAADVDRVDRVTGGVREAFERAGIEVIGRLAADGRCWWHLPREGDEPGTPYDVSNHPFAAEAVWNGLVTHGSRSDLAASLAADPERVATTERMLARPVAGHPLSSAAEAAWAVRRVGRGVQDRRALGDRSLARLLVALGDAEVRDPVLFALSCKEAEAQLAWWSDVVRRCPDRLAAAPATILGFAAWLCGHGALAWCAVDRAQRSQPGYPMADILSDVLSLAVPPARWEEMVAEVGGEAS